MCIFHFWTIQLLKKDLLTGIPQWTAEEFKSLDCLHNRGACGHSNFHSWRRQCRSALSDGDHEHTVHTVHTFQDTTLGKEHIEF
jgi:hypothetical protein